MYFWHDNVYNIVMEKLDCEIRRATENDLFAIQALNQKLFQKEFSDYDDTLEVSWPHAEHGEKYFRDAIKNGYAAVAVVNDEIVGYLAGSFGMRSYNNARYGELDNMFIEQDCRNHGIGTMLIKSFLQYCEEQNIEHVKVTAYFANNQAIELYKNNGFSEFELTLRKVL